MRLTISKVNEALKAAGIDAELNYSRRDEYFYFTGPAIGGAFQTGVYVPRLNDLSLDEWIAEARKMATAS